MICREQIAEIVECARRSHTPGAALRAHLAHCAPCQERWNTERELTEHFQVLRMHSLAPRPSLGTRREALMAEFALRNQKRARPYWTWGLSAAAAAILLLGGLSVYRGAAVPDAPQQAIAEADSFPGDEFIDVPFTPPLATGEIVRVVHADLYPEAFASLGIDIDPAWSGSMPADLVVGQDGFPRAVRLAESLQ
jgi:hypothetical protein